MASDIAKSIGLGVSLVTVGVATRVAADSMNELRRTQKRSRRKKK